MLLFALENLQMKKRFKKEQTFCRWRNKYGSMEVSEARRLTILEAENAKLKKLVAEQLLAIDESHSHREELKSEVLPPGSCAVGRSLAKVRAAGAEGAFTAVRRDGDIVVTSGLPEALEHVEAVLLAG
jgi:hypothetical protein